MLAWLLSLFGLRSRRTDDGPIDEDTAYAHSYGDRTGDIHIVQPMPEPEPEHEQEVLAGAAAARAVRQVAHVGVAGCRSRALGVESLPPVGPVGRVPEEFGRCPEVGRGLFGGAYLTRNENLARLRLACHSLIV